MLLAHPRTVPDNPKIEQVRKNALALIIKCLLAIIRITYEFIHKTLRETQKCSKYQSNIGLHIEKEKKRTAFVNFPIFYTQLRNLDKDTLNAIKLR